MQLDGLVSILQLILAVLLAVVIILAVMFLGGLLVAGVALPALLVLPTVRRVFVTFTENVSGVRPDSITDWRFLGVYLLFVYLYGFALILTPAMFAEYLTAYGWLVPCGPIGWFLAVAVVTLLGIGVFLVVRPAVTRRRLRAVGEWTVFLCLLAALVLAAAFVVPYLLFSVIGPQFL